MDTKDGRSLSPEAQEALRRRVMEAVRGGMSQSEAARVFSVARSSVTNWVRATRHGGAKALSARRRGRPAGGTLSRGDEARIAGLVVDRRPEQLKLPFYLWTREAVAQLIERRCSVALSVWTVGRYLRKWGLTPQKPVRRAFEQDPVAVKRWLKTEYPAIRARAAVEGAEIHWGDEMGLRSDHQTGTSWSLKGQTPVIPGTGKRFRCNMVSAITNRGRLAFMVFKGRFTTPVFKDFLGRLVKQLGRKVFLIVDGHPVHKAAGVRRWVEARKSQIEIFLLPSYSPHLNPDELLNNDVKGNALGRQRPEDLGEMIAGVRGYLRSTQRQPHVVRAFFEEKHVRYAAS